MPPETSLAIDSGLKMLDYAVIVLYMVSTFGIAVWFGRKQETTEDFFVGSRRMPWFAVGLSILATLFSTLTYLGMPGYTIKNGIALLLGFMAVPFSMTVVFFLWIPFFMRLRVTSAYEYLERRFNYGVRLIGATLFILLRLGWMSMVVYAASMALDRIKGGDFVFLPGHDIFWWIGAVGVAAAIYTSVGGIQAMIWTDVLQCVLLLAGVLMVIFYVMIVDQTGPLDWLSIAANHSKDHIAIPLFSPDITVEITIAWVVINNFFWTICTHGSDQVVLQRYFSTSSQKAARSSYIINEIVNFSMAMLLGLAGLALLAFYLKHGQLLPAGWTIAHDADKLFPHFLGTQLPVGCAGLIIAAFLCDAMQTLESGVNSITAVATNDIVPRLRQGRPRIVSELTFARLTTILITALVTANAFFVAHLVVVHKLTLVAMMPKFFNLFVGPLASLFVIGMFFPRCTARSAIVAVLLSLCVSVNWSWYKEIYGTKVGPTFFLSIAVPWITSVTTAFLLSFVIEKGGDHPGRKLTWFAIVKGQPLEAEDPA